VQGEEQQQQQRNGHGKGPKQQQQQQQRAGSSPAKAPAGKGGAAAGAAGRQAAADDLVLPSKLISVGGKPAAGKNALDKKRSPLQSPRGRWVGVGRAVLVTYLVQLCSELLNHLVWLWCWTCCADGQLQHCVGLKLGGREDPASPHTPFHSSCLQPHYLVLAVGQGRCPPLLLQQYLGLSGHRQRTDSRLVVGRSAGRQLGHLGA
jgi:hypothetical protein